MRKQRMLHLLSSNSFSGAENVACTIISNDGEYNMYYCCPKGPIEKALKERKIKYIPLKKLTPYNLTKVCKKYNIDIIHSHDYKASFCSAISKYKCKRISTIHTNYNFANHWTIYSVLFSMIMKKFTKIICVSEEILDDMIFARKNRERFIVLRNVIDSKRVIEKSKEFKTEKYDLIYVGRLTEVKRPSIVIEVTKKLVKKYPGFKTCIIGSGNLEEACKELIKKYKLTNNVDMLGFVSNPFPYEKNSKVAILPSIHEGLPMSVIESMILGVPVINSGVDGMKTLFLNYPEYICKSVDDYVNKISDIIEGNKEYSKKCKSIIKDAIDINNYIKTLNEIYNQEELW